MRIYTILTQQYNIKKRNLPPTKKKNTIFFSRKLIYTFFVKADLIQNTLFSTLLYISLYAILKLEQHSNILKIFTLTNNIQTIYAQRHNEYRKEL